MPRRLVPALAWGLPQLESSLGSVSLWAVIWDQRVSFALAAQAALFAAFVLTQVLIRARRPGAECGCLRAAHAITVQTVLRSGLLAAFATLGVASR